MKTIFEGAMDAVIEATQGLDTKHNSIRTETDKATELAIDSDAVNGVWGVMGPLFRSRIEIVQDIQEAVMTDIFQQ